MHKKKNEILFEILPDRPEAGSELREVRAIVQPH
jgi:hypothetical protein